MPAAPTCFSKRSPQRSKGDVLVIDNGGRHDEGCIGDLVVGEAFMSGIAGTICWGTHRDTGAILAFGAQVWSLGTCPNGPLELRRRHARRSRPQTSARSPSRWRTTCSPTRTASSSLRRRISIAIVETARDIAAREGAQAARLLKGELLRTQLDLDTYVAKRNSDPNYTFRDHLKTFGGAIEDSRSG